jgi:hypothetical protein
MRAHRSELSALALGGVGFAQAGDDWVSPPANEAFYGLAGEFVRLVEPHSEADPVSLLVQFLVAFGSAAGPNLYRVADGSRHHMNLFAVLVGKSAKSRKGTSLAHVRRFYKAVDKDWCKHRVTNGLSTGEGLIWAVRGSEDQESVQTNTPQKCLLVVEEEFAKVLKVAERKENTLSPIIRQAWDRGDLRVMTKTAPVSVTGAHISIIGHVTKLELIELLNRIESGNGFANRFLWVAVRRSRALPNGGSVDLELSGSLAKRVKLAVDFARTHENREMQFSQKAQSIWEREYASLSAERDDFVGSIISRSEAQVLRLACVYAALDCSGVLKTHHLKAARALWDFCDRSAQFLFTGRTPRTDEDVILDALRHAPNGLTRSQISALFNHNAEAIRIDGALNRLKQRGLVSCLRQGTTGRPAEVWQIVPAGSSRGALVS